MKTYKYRETITTVNVYTVGLPEHEVPTLDHVQEVAHRVSSPVGTSQITGREILVTLDTLLDTLRHGHGNGHGNVNVNVNGNGHRNGNGNII